MEYTVHLDLSSDNEKITNHSAPAKLMDQNSYLLLQIEYMNSNLGLGLMLCVRFKKKLFGHQFGLHGVTVNFFEIWRQDRVNRTPFHFSFLQKSPRRLGYLSQYPVGNILWRESCFNFSISNTIGSIFISYMSNVALIVFVSKLQKSFIIYTSLYFTARYEKWKKKFHIFCEFKGLYY